MINRETVRETEQKYQLENLTFTDFLQFNMRRFIHCSCFKLKKVTRALGNVNE